MSTVKTFPNMYITDCNFSFFYTFILLKHLDCFFLQLTIIQITVQQSEAKKYIFLKAPPQHSNSCWILQKNVYLTIINLSKCWSELMIMLERYLLIHLHTSVEPVKATLSMSLWLAMAAPAVEPNPGIMLTTPGGNSA